MAMENHGLAMYGDAAGLRLAVVVGGEVFDFAEVAAPLSQPNPPATTLSEGIGTLRNPVRAS